MIGCGDFPDWATACHTIKTDRYEREILDELMESIPDEGVLEPLTVAVRRRDLVTYLNDGHHRAVALIELSIRTFPYRWFWAPAGRRIRFERGPLPAEVLEGRRAA
jgi:hypothetical protein